MESAIRKSKYIIFGVIVWVCFSLYFLFLDTDAFILSVVLPTSFGALLYLSVRAKHISLSIFMGLAFVAHAVAPPFFFLNRERYQYSGWTAVRDFNFSLADFLASYVLVYLILVIIVFTTLISNSVIRALSRRTRIDMHITSELRASRRPLRRARTRFINLNSIVLMAFILLFAIPLNIWMFEHRIALIGVYSPVLPYKTVGILFYVRLLVIPACIMFLYFRTNRSILLTAIILGYAIFAGVAGASRSVLVFSAAPVVLVSAMDRRYLALFVTGFVTIIGYDYVSTSRIFTYGFPGIGLIEVLEQTAAEVIKLDIMELIGQVSNRLYGPQVVVLAGQYEVGNPIEGAYTFLIGRGAVENIASELFGFVLPEENPFGIGIGLMGSLLSLAHGSMVLLIILSVMVGMSINFIELLSRYVRHVEHGLDSLRMPLLLIMVYFLYDGNLRFFYWSIALSLFFIIVRGLKGSGSIKVSQIDRQPSQAAQMVR